MLVPPSQQMGILRCILTIIDVVVLSQSSRPQDHLPRICYIPEPRLPSILRSLRLPKVRTRDVALSGLSTALLGVVRTRHTVHTSICHAVPSTDSYLDGDRHFVAFVSTVDNDHRCCDWSVVPRSSPMLLVFALVLSFI